MCYNAWMQHKSPLINYLQGLIARNTYDVFQTNAAKPFHIYKTCVLLVHIYNDIFDDAVEASYVDGVVINNNFSLYIPVGNIVFWQMNRVIHNKPKYGVVVMWVLSL